MPSLFNDINILYVIFPKPLLNFSIKFQNLSLTIAYTVSYVAI